MKNFSTCSINLRRLNRGGVALYLYLTKDTKKDKKIIPPIVPENKKETKGNNFINDVKTNKLLDKQELGNDIKDTTTGKDLTEKLRKSLEDAFNNNGLADFDFNKLKLSLFDGTTELIEGEIGKDGDKGKEIKVSLSLDNLTSEDDIKIKIKYNLPLSTRGDDFIEAVQKDDNKLLTSIDGSTIENGDTGQKVITKIQEQLKNTGKDAKLDDANIFDKLDIKLIDQESKKVLSTTDKIDRIYAESDRKITIELSYNGENDLAKPKIEDITFKPKLALSTRGDDFIKAVESGELLKLLANLDKIKDGENGDKVIDFIKGKLTQLGQNNGLENIDDNLIITLSDNDGQLSGEIPASYSNNKQKIKIKLSYKDQSLTKDFENIDIKLDKSLSTRWSDFIEEVSSGNELTGLSLTGLTYENKGSEVKEKIEKHLLAKFNSIFGNNNDLKITLKDGDKDLDLGAFIPKIYLEKDKKFKIVLTHDKINGSNKIFDQDLKIDKSLSTRGNDFIQELKKDNNKLSKISLEKEIDKQTTGKDVLYQLIEQLEAQLEKYSLDPAKLYLEGFKNLETKLDNRFFKETNLKIKLGYSGVDSKADLTINKLQYSLEARWKAFTKVIPEINSLENIEPETTGKQVSDKLATQLKDKLDYYDLDPSNLKGKIAGIDDFNKKLEDTKFLKGDEQKISLGYEGIGESDYTKIIIKKLQYSLEARWKAFTKVIPEINSLENIEPETTGKQVSDKLATQLKDKLDYYDLDPSNLKGKIAGIDDFNKKLEDTKFLKGDEQKISLGYEGIGESDYTEIIIKKLQYSLEARWKAFTKVIPEINSLENIEPETTGKQVSDKLATQLKDKLDYYDLDPSNLKGKIAGIDDFNKKLEDTKFLKGDEQKISLGYEGIGESDYTKIIIKKLQYSLEARWKAFTKVIPEINSLENIEPETTGKQVSDKLATQLKDKLDYYDLDPSNLKGKIAGIDDFNKKLEDTKFLKGDEQKISLGYEGIGESDYTKIIIKKLQYSLEARWKAFTKVIPEINSLENIEPETTGKQVSDKLATQLKDKLDYYDLDPSNLKGKIAGIDDFNKKLEDTKFLKGDEQKISLGYEGIGESDYTKIIIKKLQYSLEARWKAFTKVIPEINSLENIEPETTGKQVSDKLATQLKDKLDYYDLDPSNLKGKIAGIDDFNKKLEDTKFLKGDEQKISLGYEGIGESDYTKIIIKKLQYSLEARWKAFTKVIPEINSLENIEPETTGKQVSDKLATQLKDKLDYYDLDPSNLKGKIAGIDDFNKKLEDTKFLKGDEQKISLGYEGIGESDYTKIIIKKLQYSLEARWKAFTKVIPEINSLENIEPETTGKQVSDKLATQLKDKLDYYDLDPSNLKGKIAGIDDFNKKLEDTKFLKGDEQKISLGYEGIGESDYTKIIIKKLQYSLEARWKAFTKVIPEINSLENIEPETTGKQVSDKLATQLKDKLDYYDLDPSNLKGKIAGIDDFNKKLEDTKFLKGDEQKISLGYEGIGESDYTKIIIKKLQYSLEARWKAFTKLIPEINSLENIEPETTGKQVLDKLATQLKDKLDYYDLDSSKLKGKIAGIDDFNKKLEDTKFLKGDEQKISLGYEGIGESDYTKIIIKKLQYSLEARWKAFTKVIPEINSLENIEPETTGKQVLDKLATQLKDKLDYYDLDPSNLKGKIAGIDDFNKKLEDTKFLKGDEQKISLGYEGIGESDYTKIIIKKLQYSLEARWKAFTKVIPEINSLENIEPETTGKQVSDKLATQLKDKLDYYDLDPSNLKGKIAGIDDFNKKLEDTKFLKGDEQKISLGYEGIGESDYTEIIIKKLQYSLEARWKAFTKVIPEINSLENIEPETTGKQVLDKLATQLKDKLDYYDLDPSNLKGKIAGIDDFNKKLEDTKFLKGDEQKISLGYEGIGESDYTKIIIKKLQYSLEARWKAFTKVIPEINSLENIEPETTGKQVSDKLATQLKDKLDYYDLDPSNLKGKIAGIDDFNKKLEDTKFLKGDEQKISLGYEGIGESDYTEIIINKLQYSLEARWKAFTKVIPEINSLENIEPETTGKQVSDKLATQLKDKLDYYDLDPSNLKGKIAGIDDFNKKLEDTKFLKGDEQKISLGYEGIGESDYTKIIIKKLQYSLEARWKAFTKVIPEINSLENIEPETTGKQVSDKLATQLKDKLDYYDLDPSNLKGKIAGIDDFNKKLEDTKFLKGDEQKISLGYEGIGESDYTKIIIKKLQYSLEARWKAFTKVIPEINSLENIEPETTGKQVSDKLATQLKDKLDYYDLDPSNLKGKIAGIDDLNKKLEDTKFLKGDEQKISLGYEGIGESDYTEIIIKKLQYSLEARWKAFTKVIPEINSLENIEPETTGKQVLDKLATQLKDKLDYYDLDPSNLKGKIAGIDDFNKKLEDTKFLKGDEQKISLGYEGIGESDYTKIIIKKLQYSLEARWKAFTKVIPEINSLENIEPETTGKQVSDKLATQLKDKLDYYDLDPSNLKGKIAGIDDLNKKLEDTKFLKGDEQKISLGYEGIGESDYTEIIIKKLQYSLEARWKAFTKVIPEINSLENIEPETTGKQVSDKLATQLKDKLDYYDLDPSNLKGKIAGIDDFNKKLEDTKFLKGDEQKISLGYEGIGESDYTKIIIKKLQYSLEARWKAFTKVIPEINSLENIEPETTGKQVSDKLATQLKDKLDYYDLDPSNLKGKIAGIDDFNKKLEDTKFLKGDEQKISLGYEGIGESDYTKIIIKKLQYSLEARWKAFTKVIPEINSLENIEPETTGKQVSDKLATQLKDKLDYYDLDPSNLKGKIAGIDDFNKKLEDTKFLKGDEQKISLGYEGIGESDYTKIIIKKLQYSLEARWKAFTKVIPEINSLENIEPETTGKQVLDKLATQLKDKLDYYDLDPSNLKGKIAGIDDLNKKLEDTKFLKGDEQKISLGYEGIGESDYTEIIIKKLQYSLEARWKAFTKVIPEINSLENIEPETTGKQVSDKLATQLKDKLDYYDLDPSNLKGKIAGIDDFNKKLEDTKFLKGDEQKISLGYEGIGESDYTKIIIKKLQYSLEARWKAFTKVIPEINSLENIEPETTGKQVSDKLATQLKDKLDYYDLDPSNLKGKIAGIDDFNKKLEDTKFLKGDEQKISLGYEGIGESDYTEIIINKLQYSLEARWKAFTKVIPEINSLENIEPETTGKQVSDKLATQLKDKLDYYDLDPSNLKGKIAGIDDLNKKLEDTKFLKGDEQKISLGYEGIGESDYTEIIIKKLQYSLEARWKAFTKVIPEINSLENIEPETTGKQVSDKLATQLKDKLDYYDLDPSNLKGKIAGIDDFNKKLEDTKFLKGDEQKISLGYEGIGESDYTKIIIKKLQYSLEARWKAFTKVIPEINSLENIEPETTGKQVSDKLATQLKDKLDYYDLDPSNLKGKIAGIDDFNKKLEDTKFLKGDEQKISLGYEGIGESDYTEIIIKKLQYSLEARWKAFTKVIPEINSLENIEPETTGKQVLDKLATQLKDKLDYYDLDPSNLKGKIAGIDDFNKKLEDTKFLKGDEQKISLGYEGIGESDYTKIIIKKLQYSLEARWKAFTKVIPEINSLENIEPETTGKQVSDKLATQLKDKLDYYDLDPSNLKGKIAGIDDFNKKLEDTKFLKGDEQKISLGYEGIGESDYTEIIIKKLQYSLEARWKAFTKVIPEINSLENIEPETTGKQVLDKLATQLKDKLDYYDLDPSNLKGKIAGIDDFNKKLEDTKFLKGDEQKISLGYEGIGESDYTEIIIKKLQYSLEARWKAFTKVIPEINSLENIEPETTGKQVLDKLATQLKDKLDYYDLDPSNLKGKIAGIDDFNKKLEDTKFLKGDEQKISLGYEGIGESDYTKIIIKKLQYSLEARWKAFTKVIPEINSLENIEPETTGKQVSDKLATQLKDKLDYYDLDPSNLKGKIAGIDDLNKKLEDTKFLKGDEQKISLGYEGIGESDYTEIIIKKLQYSLEARWKAFTKVIPEINSLENIEPETTGKQVLDKLATQLKDKLDYYDLDPSNLKGKIAGIDDFNKKLEDTKFLKGDEQKISLGYEGIGESDYTKIIIKKLQYSLEARWKAFTKVIPEINSLENIEPETTGKQVLDKLATQLKDKLDYYDLDPSNLKGKIAGIDDFNKKLEDTKFLKGDEQKISLGYEGIGESDYTKIIIKKLQYSLEARWKAFTKVIPEINSLENIEPETTGKQVSDKLATQLKDKLDYYDLDPSNLKGKIAGIDDFNKKLEDTKFLKGDEQKISLGYEGIGESDYTEIIIKKLQYSLEARWKAFTKVIPEINSLENIEPETTGKQVLDKLATQLKDKLDYYDLDPSNLKGKIAGIDDFNKKLEDTKFLKGDEQKISLGYEGIGESDYTKIIIKKLQYSLEARWKAFTKVIPEINSLENIEPETTGKQVSDKLATQLKDKLDYYDLDPSNLKGKIAGIDDLNKKLEDTKFLKGDEQKISLGYEGIGESDYTEIIIKKLQYSLEARWKAFTKVIPEINSLENIEPETTGKQVLDKLATQLKDKLDYYDLDPSNLKGKIAGIDDFNKKLEDTKFLKGDEQKISLGYEGIGESDYTKIIIKKLQYSLEARWKAFTKVIPEINSLENIEPETTGKQVSDKLATQLKDKLDYYDLDPSNLKGKIAGIDDLNKKLEDTKFLKGDEQKISLGYEGIGESDYTEIIIKKLQYSLEARWKAFTKVIPEINSLENIEPETTGKQVSDKLATQLKDKLDYYDLDPSNLKGKIAGIDDFNKKLEDTKFLKGDEQKISLGYEGIGESDYTEIIIKKLQYSLEARWKAFTKVIPEINSLENIEPETTGKQVLDKLATQLKDKLDYYDLDPSNLKGKIAGIDDSNKKLEDTKFLKGDEQKISLGYEGIGESDYTEIIIKKLQYSLEARWKAFTNNDKINDYLKSLANLDKIKDGENGDKVIDFIKGKLTQLGQNNGLENIDDNLIITLSDNDGQLSGEIPASYSNNKQKIKIKLSYKDQSLTKDFEDIDIQLAKSLSTRWTNFADDAETKELLESIKDGIQIEDGQTGEDVISAISAKLSDLGNNNNLGDINNLDIKLYAQEDKDKPLTGNIPNSYSNNNQKIKIKLSYKEKPELTKEFEDINIQLAKSLSTRGNGFIKEVETNKLLESIDGSKITNFHLYKELIPLFREKLKNLFENTHNLGGISKLSINLFTHQITPLIDQEIGQVGNKKIMVRLSTILDRKLFIQDIDIKIKTQLSIKKLKDIVYKLLLHISNNNLLEFKKTFLAKLKEGNFEYKHYGLEVDDFAFSFKEATISDNLVSVTIKPKNNEKLKDTITVTNSYNYFKLDLGTMTWFFKNLVNQNQPDNVEEFKSLLQKMFDTRFKDYKVDVENDLIVRITPPIFNIQSAGNFHIQYKNGRRFKNSSLNNIIGYYDKFKIDFTEFENALTKILTDNPVENKQELSNIIKKLLDEGDFNKYKNQKIIDFSDLIFQFKPNNIKTSIQMYIALNRKGKGKALSKYYFLITTPHKFYKMFNDFKEEFKQDKNLASLRKHLEKQDSYSTGEELDEIARKGVKDKYGSKYKRIFDVGSLDIHFFSPTKLTGEISDIYYEKKEFSGSIFIRLQQNTNFLYSHYENFEFKLNLTSLNLKDPKYNLIGFVDNLLEKAANNDEKTFIDLFIKKLNSIKGFKNKFKKEDFDFVFKPATKKDNKIEIEITPKNKNKIQGKIQRHSYYEKYMIDLEDQNITQDIQNLINKNQPDNQEVFEKLLQAYFDSKYKDYAIDVKQHLSINFNKPIFNNLKDGDLNISANQSVRKFKNKLIIPIPYYDKYKLDFSEFENKLKDKLTNNTPNNKDELRQIVKEFLNTYSLNKYNNQNIINIDDLIINYYLNKPITKSSLIEITISLKQDKKLKSRKNKTSFVINLTPKVVFEHRDFVEDLNKTNNLNSLKQFLEKETFSYGEEVEKKVITGLKDNYGSKYKLLFDKEKIEIDFSEGHKLTDKIRTDRKEFDGKIKIRFNNNEFNFEDEFNFKFNVINPLVETLLEDYAKEINNKTLNNMVFKFNYYFNSYDFISDLEDQIKEFFKNKKLNGEVVKSNILNKDKLKFKTGNNSIFIKLTYLGVTKDITLKYNGQKLDLSKYPINDVITISRPSPLNEYAFDKVDLKKSDFIYKFVETLKGKYSDFNGIDIDKYIKLFTFEYNGPLFAANPTENYTFYLTSTLKDFVTGRVEVRFSAKKISFIIEKLLEAFLKEKTKLDENFRDMMFYYSYRTYFDGAGMKKFEQIKEHFRQEIEEKLKNKILQDGGFSKIMYRNDIKDYKNFSVTNLSFDKDYSFQDTNLKFKIGIKYNGGQSTNNSFISIKQEITNPFNMKMKNYGLSYDDGLDFLNILNNEQKEYNYTIKADKSNDNVGDTETGFINTDADDFTDIKGFIKSLIMVVGIKGKKYVPKLDEEISSDDNGYFFYFLDEYGIKKSVVLRVFVDYYNNDGNYQKDINYSFSSGNIEFQLLHMKNTIYGASKVYDGTQHNRKYKLINRTEYEGYSKFRSELDNKNEVESSGGFDPSNDVRYAGQYILDKNISGSSPKLGGTYGGKGKHDGNDHFLYEFGLENKDGISNGRKYVLKLGGTGDIEKIYKTNTGYFLNYQMKYAFTILGGKVRLNFNLYRSDDYDRTNDKLLLPIGKGKRYHLAR